ncbi:hypothetical protein NBRC111893_2353 [Lentilactobacillus kosonis]|uniref:Uncharacterized protein n=1 Tax=Lentilactobacillus kosonis TaxID=2810561 RepID=A0A401FPE5_9LACO|nr:hypothetical protein NBRC111893_2353 [Lentilactobacillus kosonis]
MSVMAKYPDHYLWMKQNGYELGQIQDLPSEVLNQDNV